MYFMQFKESCFLNAKLLDQTDNIPQTRSVIRKYFRLVINNMVENI